MQPPTSIENRAGHRLARRKRSQSTHVDASKCCADGPLPLRWLAVPMHVTVVWPPSTSGHSMVSPVAEEPPVPLPITMATSTVAGRPHICGGMIDVSRTTIATGVWSDVGVEASRIASNTSGVGAVLAAAG